MRRLILNLANPENGDIKYKISQFPDGQQSIDIISHVENANIQIASRMNSFRDVELIVAANQTLKDLGAKTVSLYVPYFLGARSDRKFQSTSTNYLKNVICPIINLQQFHTVQVLDPHSDVLEACLTNFVKTNNYAVVKFALTDIDNRTDAQERICLVSPDAGAYKKIFDVAQYYRINNVATATKIRDLKTGKIIHTEIPNLPVSTTEAELKYVIVDDICDGGRTFIEIAKAIKSELPDAKIYLIVTHGIFSNGYAELGEYFEQMYTTNSVKNIGETEYHALANTLTKVKQLNVF